MRHSVGIVGIEALWLLLANLLAVGLNVKYSKSGKEFQHSLDRRKPYEKS